MTKPFGVLVDALVELGRYRAAGRALQAMVDRKPDLASYARVSYFRELHGDLDGAVGAMRLAASAGGDAPENVAYVQTLLGGLELQRGRPPPASARTAWRWRASLATRRRGGARPRRRGHRRPVVASAASSAWSSACRCPSTSSRSARRAGGGTPHGRRTFALVGVERGCWPATA